MWRKSRPKLTNTYSEYSLIFAKKSQTKNIGPSCSVFVLACQDYGILIRFRFVSGALRNHVNIRGMCHNPLNTNNHWLLFSFSLSFSIYLNACCKVVCLGETHSRIENTWLMPGLLTWRKKKRNTQTHELRIAHTHYRCILAPTVERHTTTTTSTDHELFYAAKPTSAKLGV